MLRCIYCSKEGEDLPLQIIESIFDADPEETSRLLGRKVTDTTGADTLTVCKEPCADVIRQNSSVIIRDEPFN